MKKILIVQNSIAPYRIEIFNLLSQKYDLTVLYTAGKEPENVAFKTIREENKKGRLFWKYKNAVKSIFAPYDVVIVPMDVRQIDVVKQVRRKKTKIISWGIGVSASYKVPFDSKRSVLVERTYIRNSAACLFYSQYAADKYEKILKGRAFVANNTVIVRKIDRNTEKHHLLFIGSLYPQKRIEELLQAYACAHAEDPAVLPLKIVGDGSEREKIEQFVESNGLQHKITLCGQIYDEMALEEIFAGALACISPNQAGLSVLKAMGYGVPFVTHKDAITGGERLNIKHGENGILFDDFDDMKQIILDCTREKEKFLNMGKCAYDHYWSKRTPAHMVDGFSQAIEFVLQAKAERGKK